MNTWFSSLALCRCAKRNRTATWEINYESEMNDYCMKAAAVYETSKRVKIKMEAEGDPGYCIGIDNFPFSQTQSQHREDLTDQSSIC